MNGLSRLALVATAASLAGCTSVLPVEPTAPAECGFPDGTALVFAGQATTATLGVQEALGDPMSNDPADIYITRDELPQGDLHGRLVCAVYGATPDFVEVTVAPEGWNPETGRPSMTAPSSNVPTDTPAASRPERLLSRDGALAAVHQAAPGTDHWEILVTTVGPIQKVNPNWNLSDWSRELPEDTWVWYVALRSGDEGVFIFLDASDGRIYEVTPVIID